MTHTPDQIKEAIKNFPNLSVEDLAHQFKCASSKANKVYKPFLEAALKEIRKRQKPIEDSVSKSED